MSGLFGGILEFVNILGGVILYLLIGKKAWKHSNTTRYARLNFGGIFVGFVLATTLYFNGDLDIFKKHEVFVPIVLIPFFVLVSVLCLEILRKKIDVRGEKMKPTKIYQEVLLTELLDPDEAAEYLIAALEDADERVFWLALLDVAEANGLRNLPSSPPPSLKKLLNTLHLRFATAAK